MGFVICIIIGLLSTSGIISSKGKTTGMCVVGGIFLIYLLIHSLRNWRRSNYDWDMYKFGKHGVGKNQDFMDATGYDNDSLLCKSHPNLCKVGSILNNNNNSTRTKIYEVDKLYKDMKKIRKKDYCELQEIERYYKDMEKERTKLYQK